jgi:alpha-amylase
MADLNGTIMQYFHWYSYGDGNHWTEVKRKAKELANAGFTALWLPPAYKGIFGRSDVGYGAYDLFDLGEFDQKGSVRTKYGTRQQYLEAIKAVRSAGMQIYADAVLNYKLGGDGAEVARATPYAQSDRLQPKGELQDVRSYTHFDFPGRDGKYSTFEWHWWHFNAVDHNEYHPDDDGTVYLYEGRQFDDRVALEKGTPYLMGCDLNFQDEWVRGETTYWGQWYLDTTGVDGFRLGALKYNASWFLSEWLHQLEQHADRDLFAVGEYWYTEVETLHWYLDAVGSRLSMFDVPLHYNFHQASQLGQDYDLRTIFNNTLVQQRPLQAVTFVESHNSQPLQALESVVESWFKPLAYALVLLRQAGYPCVFYADYYGADYEDWGGDGQRHRIVMPSHRWLLDKFLFARTHYAYGPQYDYFDQEHTIGWTRLGTEEHPGGMAVLMSNAGEGHKWMDVGQPNTVFYDITQHIPDPVQTNESGWAEFRCSAGSVSVWVEQRSFQQLVWSIGSRLIESLNHRLIHKLKS